MATYVIHEPHATLSQFQVLPFSDRLDQGVSNANTMGLLSNIVGLRTDFALTGAAHPKNVPSFRLGDLSSSDESLG